MLHIPGAFIAVTAVLSGSRDGPMESASDLTAQAAAESFAYDAKARYCVMACRNAA